jgi:hypothetical protein
MTHQSAKAHREKLATMEVPAEHAAAVLDRIVDILGYHVAKIDGQRPLSDQMKSLAFDAYTQGLMDGARVGGRLRPECVA